MQAQNSSGENDNWMPLESNPQVINPFIAKMGLHTELVNFQQMLSTQEWALQMIPQPVLGVLFLFEETPVQIQFKNQEAQTLSPQQIPPNVFFMKQHARNACGTIALFHMILNALEENPEIVEANSYLAKFKAQSEQASPDKRGELFKESKQILTEHKSAVNQGQSQVQNECNSHFISFIPKNGRCYELDGMKKCPVDHGECSQQQFLARAAQVITAFMARDPQNLNFSMIVLAKAQE